VAVEQFGLDAAFEIPDLFRLEEGVDLGGVIVS